MSSGLPHAVSTTHVACCDGSDHSTGTVVVSLDRLQRLEACEAQADVQERHIELLQKQIAETDAALKLELARGEKHAEALMHIARMCDARTGEMKEQHAAVLRVKDATIIKLGDDNAALKVDNAALKAKHVELASSNAATTTKLEARDEVIASLKTENAVLKAQTASSLTQIIAAITTGAMEILPVRSDRRQFVEWRVGGIPPPPAVEVPLLPQFDRAWCAVVCARGGKADVDAAAGDARATVTESSRGYFTLRSAAPLSRPRRAAAPANVPRRRRKAQ
jgi:hypothetical protein